MEDRALLRTEMIRLVLDAHGHLSVDVATLDDGDDLYSVGLTSHASVNVMLALEDTFDIEFPDRLLRKSTFATVGAIDDALAELLGSPSATPNAVAP